MYEAGECTLREYFYMMKDYKIDWVKEGKISEIVFIFKKLVENIMALSANDIYYSNIIPENIILLRKPPILVNHIMI
jgi:hypothetical protein